jgi:exosortase A
VTTLARPLSLDGLVRSHLAALGFIWVAIFLLFLRDFADVVRIWWGSSTFNHCLLIPPIIAWLVWQRWPVLRDVVPRGWMPGLLLVGAGALAWLLGQAAGVAIARHLGLVLMLQGSVIAILGPEIARGLVFPLAYMVFMVPAGEELVPPLQTLTARMCMGLLDLVGIPAHIDGVFITIPNGWFEVAEACSGVKFLVAMAAYGVLAAHICFKSWPRRIAFIVAALALPVLANGVRAWGTIYVAHRTNAHFAVGFDHVLYGWIFFAVVIALLMGGSWRWFDRPPTDIGIDLAALQAPARATDRLRPAVLAVLLIISGTAAWAKIASTGQARLPDAIAPPAVAGWTRTAPPTDWHANFTGADRMFLSRYVDRRGHVVDVAVALFASQSEGRELVGYGQGAVPSGSSWAWTDDQHAPPNGRAFRITGLGGVVRDVVLFYRVGDITTGSELRVKAETLKVRLLGGRKRAVALIVSAPQTVPLQNSRPVIDAFLDALGPVDQAMDRLAGNGD